MFHLITSVIPWIASQNPIIRFWWLCKLAHRHSVYHSSESRGKWPDSEGHWRLPAGRGCCQEDSESGRTPTAPAGPPGLCILRTDQADCTHPRPDCILEEGGGGAGSHEVRQAVTEACINLSGSWRQILNLKMQRRWCNMDAMGATFTPQLSLISVSLLAKNNNQLDYILTNRLNYSCCCSKRTNTAYQITLFLSPHQPYLSMT